MGTGKGKDPQEKLLDKLSDEEIANVRRNLDFLGTVEVQSALRAESNLMSRKYLTEAQLAFIGTVAVESTYNEFFVQSLIGRLSGVTEEVGLAFTQNMPMSARLETLRVVGRTKLSDPAQIEQFNNIVSSLCEANAERNTVIHGKWGPTVNPLFFFVLKFWKKDLKNSVQAKKSARAGKKKEPIPFPVEQLEAVALKLHDSRKALRDFETTAWQDPEALERLERLYQRVSKAPASEQSDKPIGCTNHGRSE